MKLNEDYFNIVLIILFSFVLRFIIPFSYYAFNPKYQFLGTKIPYYTEADSYYFARILENIGLNRFMVYVIPILILIWSLIIFYFLLIEVGMDKKKSLLCTLILSSYPYFYNQTLIGYIDTPFLIILSIVCIYYYYLKFIQEYNFIYGIQMLFWLIFINFVWTGRPLIYLMFLGSVLFKWCIKFWHYLVFAAFTIVGYMMFYSRFAGLLYQKAFMVAEYQTPDWLPYYILCISIIVASLILWFKLPTIYKLFFASFLFNFIISIFISRFALFTTIFMVVCIAILLTEIDESYILPVLAALLVINLFTLVTAYAYYHPIMNNEYELLIHNATKELPVLTYWDNGHHVEYFNKTSLYMAAPTQVGMFVNAYLSSERIGTEYLDNLANNHSYYLLIRDDDYYKMLYFKKEVSMDNIFNLTNYTDFIIIASNKEGRLLERISIKT